MRPLLVFLLLALILLPDTDGWWRGLRRRRRRTRRRRNYMRICRCKTVKRRKGRDTNEADPNKDAQKVRDARAVKDFLPLVDEDGNSEVRVDELSRTPRDLMTIDLDPDLRSASEEAEEVDDLNSSE